MVYRMDSDRPAEQTARSGPQHGLRPLQADGCFFQYGVPLSRSPFGHVDQSIGKNTAADNTEMIPPNMIIKDHIEKLPIDRVKLLPIEPEELGLIGSLPSSNTDSPARYRGRGPRG